ncbi:MAG: hypothetical protein ACRCUK_09660, partial [Plesiomonas shigelloides]
YEDVFAQQVRETLERKNKGLAPPAWAATAFQTQLKNTTKEEADAA